MSRRGSSFGHARRVGARFHDAAKPKLTLPQAHLHSAFDFRDALELSGPGTGISWLQSSNPSEGMNQDILANRPILVPSYAPLGGKQVGHFNGNGWLNWTIETAGQSHTIIIVLDSTSYTTNYLFRSAGVGSEGLFYARFNAGWVQYLMNALSQPVEQRLGAQTLAFVNDKAAGLANIYYNGVAGTAAGYTSGRLGGVSTFGSLLGGSPLRGYVAAVFVYDKALDATEISEVRAYTHQEWGI